MNLPDRKHNRLENFDYNKNGCYFVTLCTNRRQHLFKIEQSLVGNDLCVVPPNDLCTVPPMQNQIISKWIKETENKYKNIHFDKYVIMPDHLHFIIRITEQHTGCSLQDVMRFFKTMSTNEYINSVRKGLVSPFDKKLWQKSYYDHVIRNQQDYNEIWEYIENNPRKWILTQNKIIIKK